MLCGLEGLWACITKGKSIAEGLPLQLANGQLLQQIDVAEAEQNKRIITNYHGVLKKLQALITIFLSPTKVSFDPDAVENDISLLQCMGQYLLHHNKQAIEATADRLVICAKALHATGLETLGAGTIDHLEAVADSVESTPVMPLRSVAQVIPTTVIEIIDIIPWSVTPLLLVKGAPSQTLKLLLQSRFAAGEYPAKFKKTLPKELIASLKDVPTLLHLNLKTLTQCITQFWSKTLTSPDKMILKKLYEPLCSDFAGEGAGICAAGRLLRTMAEVLLEPLAMHESNRWLLLSLLALQPDEDSGHFNDAMTRFFCNDGVFAALWQRQVSVIFGTVAVVPGLKTVQKHIATNKAWYSWTAPPYSRHMQRLRIVNRATARQALQTHRLYVGMSDRRAIVTDREAVDALLQPVCSAQSYQQVREHIKAWVARIVSRCGDYPQASIATVFHLMNGLCCLAPSLFERIWSGKVVEIEAGRWYWLPVSREGIDNWLEAVRSLVKQQLDTGLCSTLSQRAFLPRNLRSYGAFAAAGGFAISAVLRERSTVAIMDDVLAAVCCGRCGDVCNHANDAGTTTS